MNVIRKNSIEDWAVGCVIKYDNEYCLIIQNDFTVGRFALLNIETNNVVETFSDIDELDGVELIASDLDVSICF